MLPVRKNDSWLPSILSDFMGNDWMNRMSQSTPAVNIIENPEDYTVEIAVPGMGKEDFNIELKDDNELVINMERGCNKCEGDQEAGNNDDNVKVEKEETGKYLRREFFYSHFQQTLLIPEDVDRNKIKATQKDGVLTIILPKRSEAEKEKMKKRIEIE